MKKKCSIPDMKKPYCQHLHTFHFIYYLFVRRTCPKSKTDYNTGPYSSGDVNQTWPTAITPIPRATTNVYEAPPMEMTEGSGRNTTVEKKSQSNGLVSSHAFLLSQLRSANPYVLMHISL